MSLLRTARRAAVASAVHGGVQRRQRGRWAAVDAAAPNAVAPQPETEPAPVAQGNDVIAQLERLVTLRDAGALTDAEFEAQKARILG